MIPLSVLDLAPITAGNTAADAFRNSLDLAQRAEALGYNRYWLAEHHNMPGIASAATSVVIAHIASGTKKIRVGAGGIMLPNHSPLIIAEQFGTLESLFPGRIDLGLGRAPGSDQRTARALRREIVGEDSFPKDVVELQSYFLPSQPGQTIHAVPGTGLNVPLWILGSSLFGAQLAAALGLPYAFASHFAPDALMDAIHIYRQNFKPSQQLSKPYVMLGVNIIVADSEGDANKLFTSLQQQFVNLRRGTPGQFPPPRETMEGYWSDLEHAGVDHALSYSFVGNQSVVSQQLQNFIEMTNADELIVTAPIFDHSERVRSFELLADLAGK